METSIGSRSVGLDPTLARELELAEVMSAIAAGDQAAVFTLRERFEPELTRAVRTISSHRQARLGPAEVADIVVDVVLDLAELAGSWKPGGAPPWVWARHRVAAVVDRHIGQYASTIERADLEPVAEPPAPAGHEPEVLDLLERMAPDHPGLSKFRQALLVVASGRDRVIFLEFAVQVSLGDPSPANTVARLHGLRPDAVRQQCRRVRLRMQALAESDPHFGELAELGLVA